LPLIQKTAYTARSDKRITMHSEVKGIVKAKGKGKVKNKL